MRALSAKIQAEKAVAVGAVTSVAWWAVDYINTGDVGDWRALTPIVMGAILRVFVTSENVAIGFTKRAGDGG